MRFIVVFSLRLMYLVMLPISLPMSTIILLFFRNSVNKGGFGYRVYRKLHVLTIGLVSIVMARLTRNEPLNIDEHQEVTDLLPELEKNGIVVFKNPLSRRELDRILKLFENDLIKRTSSRWDVPLDILVNSEVVNQVLIRNSRFQSLARRYLNAEPVCDLVAAWRSYPTDNKMDLNAAAQMWHFDLDSTRWLKIFIYLTDVSYENGPHQMIAKTHNILPMWIWRDGRFKNRQLSRKLVNNTKTVVGKAGSIVAVDTRALHRGLPLVSGYRDIIQVQFSASSFGKLTRLNA